MQMVRDMFDVSPDTWTKLATTLVVVVLFVLLRFLICSIVKRRVSDPARFYHARRVIINTLSVVALVIVGRVWIQAMDSLATFLGLVSAGLAVAMHDTIANLTGWLFILWRKPFVPGDRIQIGDVSGDVIDLRLFQFSLIEVGNWVDADQSTGRIVHVPNSRVLRDPVSNYETGFKYIWHEIPVLITFESNWVRAKDILQRIAAEHAEHLSEGAQEQIRRAAMKYLIFFRNLTPKVYTSVRESGVLLTIRYIVKPRQRRDSEAVIWEAVLEAFRDQDDIALAYPTTRFFQSGSQSRSQS